MLQTYAKQSTLSLQKGYQEENRIDLFRLPLNRAAYNEFIIFDQIMNDQNLLSDQKDTWTFIWGSLYSSEKYYKQHFKSLTPPRPMQWIWKSKCVPKIKFFAWLLLNDRLNTRNMLRRRHKHLDEGYSCALCLDNVEETLEHLFFECSTAVSRWFCIGFVWDMQGSIFQMIERQRSMLQLPFFMEVFMIAAWCIWNERNAWIFNGKTPSLAAWKLSFANEVKLHLHKISPVFHLPVMNWLSSL
jgi:hypothetical protein